jgi:hypothetical protein
MCSTGDERRAGVARPEIPAARPRLFGVDPELRSTRGQVLADRQKYLSAKDAEREFSKPGGWPR